MIVSLPACCGTQPRRTGENCHAAAGVLAEKVLALSQRRPATPSVNRECTSLCGSGAHSEPNRYFIKKPASVISCRWLVSAPSSHLRNSAPDIVVVLKAPFSMYSFQSGVARTFVRRST